MAQHQMDKTPSQCREKIKKLKTIYRNLNNGRNVSRKIHGRLIHKLHSVMGGITVGLPPASDKDPASVAVEANQEEVGGEEVERQRTSVLSDEFANNFPTTLEAGDDFLADGDSSTVSSDPETVSSSEIDQVEVPITAVSKSTKSSRSTKKPSRRKKDSRSKRRSAIYVLIDKVIAAQSAANERFAALEER